MKDFEESDSDSEKSISYQDNSSNDVKTFSDTEENKENHEEEKYRWKKEKSICALGGIVRYTTRNNFK